jgi:hypothetical protein
LKKTKWFLVILLMITLYGCSGNVSEKKSIQDTNNMELLKDVDYELFFEKFELLDEVTHTDILIEYPQIKKMKSPELEMKVNALFKEKAISVYEDDDTEGLRLQIETNIEYLSSNIISVKYSGYGFYDGAINGNNIMYATNIDIKTGKIINIQDIFNDRFREMLNREIFMSNGEGKAGEGEAIEPNTHEYGYINADESIISDMFDLYYSSLSSEKYYFSEEYFSIIVKVPSGPTAYLELVANYNDLKDCMNYDDGFWDVILKSK